MIAGSVPAIVVSLPARTLGAARDEVVRARAAGATLAEVRFDRWTPAERTLAPGLFPSPLPLIATLRSRAEGGEGPDDPAERSAILADLGRLPFRWIDLESARDSPDRLPRPAESIGWILSTHRPTSVGVEEWSALLRESGPRGSIRKVVVRATVGSLLRDLVPALPPAGENALVAVTTGPSGPLLRAWAGRLGFPLVFASLPDDGPQGMDDGPVEASQIPVNWLRPFLSDAEGPPLFGLAGHPVAHSRSPSLHARWIRRSRRTGLYVALDFESDKEFLESLAPLAERGFRGLNVTHPFKTAALEAATEVGPGAAACGVANCLTFRGEIVEAENTDLAAILRRLEELRRLGRWDGQALSVVGGGGAARATLAAARVLGCERRVYGRHAGRIEKLAGEFGARTGPLGSPSPDRLVVHATLAGRADVDPLEVPLTPLLGPGTHVVDWVYRPVDASVREATVAAGGTYEDGTRLLVYQAASSFGLWWGDEPGPEEIARTLAEEGCTE
jgi:shikimate 5-dehydrogenase/3-dehydroquinate dehydratase